MPTRHPRHTLTEVNDVAVALQRARELMPEVTDGQRLRRLVTLGADALAEETRRELRARRARAQLALIDSGAPQDEQALVLVDALDDPNPA
jgi:hypothetical protein